ncbi:MAG TPA: ABC transporter substrate-binding protein [Candidatus Limnocylindria bacterium]|jgi:NitT/TauT family transport system substrate-binding protein|nr:ABC transporter substrate-binding protein [Candidatus Limnocylindria bacterium]
MSVSDRATIAIGLTLTLILAACGPAPAPSPSGAASATAAAAPRPPKDQLKLPSVVSTELNLGSLIAYAKDYFGEENIEITDFVLGSSGTLRAAVIAKEYDFGLFAFVHDPIARIAGSPWKAVVATYDREIFSLLVRTPLKDKVKTVADLKGMNVGVTGAGSGSWAMANVYLKKAGLTPDKDVSLVNLGGDPSVIYTALQSGKVDAISSWEPITSRVLETGAGFALVSIWDPKAHQEWVGSDHALGFALMTREDVIQSKPDLVQRMVNAHKKALSFIRASSADTLADTVLKNAKTAEQFSGLDRAIVVKLIDRIKSGYGTGCLSKSGFEVEMNIAVSYQLVKQPITFAEFGDTRYAGECP